MKDDRGLYYYPFPGNRQVRMYIREAGGSVEFRMWTQKDPNMWKEHGWVPYEAIREAAGMYRGAFDPDTAYDLDIARTLIADNR
ncbi:hypothetical protein D3OALGA1CA_3119 [Olavius algarvensis associated proteobacterium Delta 3]|nr:hypothetical protein D3OALGA1CA_3119 [Olavius algarvensis associated proteobacterium Delta 3]CAB5158917.1 hypothetical protein D3OALGB2SA_5301 [Olavius algarvensis associated proteobacterium Delta 3]